MAFKRPTVEVDSRAKTEEEMAATEEPRLVKLARLNEVRRKLRRALAEVETEILALGGRLR
jgi:hypothetical protein